jgi:hypothetical protein
MTSLTRLFGPVKRKFDVEIGIERSTYPAL